MVTELLVGGNGDLRGGSGRRWIGEECCISDNCFENFDRLRVGHTQYFFLSLGCRRGRDGLVLGQLAT
jgi:hypothetical protein